MANLPQAVRQELFHNKTLTEVANDVCTKSIHDQSWIQPIADKAHLIWENMLSSGALQGTVADLSHIQAVTADANSEGNDISGAASGGGFDDGFKKQVLNYIDANQKGKRGDGKTTKPEFFLGYGRF